MVATGKTLGSCLCVHRSVRYFRRFRRFLSMPLLAVPQEQRLGAWRQFFAAGATIDWLSGADNVTSYALPETQHARSFCKTCGSALPNLQMDGALLVVPAGSLDTRSISARRHIFAVQAAPNWDADLADIPHMDGLPG
jgi:hypothetical protein